MMDTRFLLASASVSLALAAGCGSPTGDAAVAAGDVTQAIESDGLSAAGDATVISGNAQDTNFGAGRSLDYQHIAKLPSVERVVMSDVVDLRGEAEFINITTMPADLKSFVNTKTDELASRIIAVIQEHTGGTDLTDDRLVAAIKRALREGMGP